MIQNKESTNGGNNKNNLICNKNQGTKRNYNSARNLSRKRTFGMFNDDDSESNHIGLRYKEPANKRMKYNHNRNNGNYSNHGNQCNNNNGFGFGSNSNNNN